jgi:hypothetical protein
MLLPGILLFLFLASCLLYLVIARRNIPVSRRPPASALARHPAGRSRAAARPAPIGPDDDPEFLRQLARRIHGDPTV